VEGAGDLTISIGIPVPDYVAFDTETTGLVPEQDHIIEVGLVRFHNGEPVDRWTSLIKPEGKVGLKTLRLTGIALEDLEDGMLLDEVSEEIEEFRGDLPLVGHNPEFDVAFLAKSIPGFPGVLVYDTLELARIVYPGFKSYKLSDLAQNLDIVLDDAHRACDDAEASGILFCLIQKRIASMSVSMRDRIVHIMGDSWPMAHLFKFGSGDGFQQPSLFELDACVSFGSPSAEALPDEVNVCDLDDMMGTPSCDKDSRWFEDVIYNDSPVSFLDSDLDDDTVRNVLGGCLNVSEAGHRILVAGDFGTSEIALDDVSFLSPPKQYLCTLKAQKAYDLARHGLLAELDIEERRFLSSVMVWEPQTETGLFSELQVAGKARGVQQELSCSDIPGCTEFCPVQADCHYLRAMREAESCKVVLTPKEECFDVPVSGDIAVILGLADVMALWEGMQPELDLSGLTDILYEAGYGSLASDVCNLSSECLSALNGKPNCLVPEKILKTLVRLYADASAVALELRAGLREKTASIVALPLDPPIVSRTLHVLEHCLGEIAGIVTSDAQGVRIISKGYSFGDRANVLISKRSVWPAYDARRHLLAKHGKLVFLSPDVSFISRFLGLRKLYGLEDDDFLAAKGRCGMVGGARNDGVMLLCIDTGRFMSGREHVEFVSSFLERLVTVVPENVLCLCPSYGFAKDLNSVVTPRLEERSIAVFAQGVDGGPKILEHLVEPDTLVLLRFGAGIRDLGRIAPRILVIPKIPFAPPSLVLDLRRQDLNTLGRNGFLEANVLPIALSLRSYVESIVRSTGKLAVIFLDPKLLPGQRGWGRDFMESFQDMERVVCPQEQAIARVSQWLRG